MKSWGTSWKTGSWGNSWGVIGVVVTAITNYITTIRRRMIR